MTLNIYQQYVIYLQFLEQNGFSSEQKNFLEKHHILPLHGGGKKEGPIVLCTVHNHTLAHYYRYLAYGQLGDKVAYQMRWNQKLGFTHRGLLSAKINKQRGNLFWNSEWQREQGKKGGKNKKGGSQNTKKQRLARSKVGNTYGFGSENPKKFFFRSKGGLKNSKKQKRGRSKSGLKSQSEVLRYALSKIIIWEYKTSTDYCLLIVLPQE